MPPRRAPRAVLLSALLIGLVLPATAQDEPRKADTPNKPIRNAPTPRAMELAAYIFSASNVCGYRIGAPEFEALLAKQNVKPEDVNPNGPFGRNVVGMFTLMSNDMARHREQSCLAVAGEYGPEGSIARNVLQPAAAGEPPADGKTPEAKPDSAKPKE